MISVCKAELAEIISRREATQSFPDEAFIPGFSLCNVLSITFEKSSLKMKTVLKSKRPTTKESQLFYRVKSFWGNYWTFSTVSVRPLVAMQLRDIL